MHVFPLLNGRPRLIKTVDDLLRQLLVHRLSLAFTGIAPDPTKSQGVTAILRNADRHLIRRPTYAPGFCLQERTYII
jgi:hypothetical protein